jgi:DNA-binding Lrp family transcriptional regulator
VLGVLEHRAYLDGTRYYETAECFLFFSARLLHKVRDEALYARLARLLRERVLEREGCTGDALALAMRVIVGAAVGLRLERDLASLLPLQYEDGGWGPSWIYKYGSSDIKIGNRGLTTALALNAIAALNAPQPQPPQSQSQPQQEGKQKQKQKQKQEQKQEKLELLEKEAEEKEKLPRIGEGFYKVEISPLPLPQWSVTSVIRGSTSTGLLSSPSLPLPQMRRRRQEETFSLTAFVKGAFAFLFSRISRSDSSLPSHV